MTCQAGVGKSAASLVSLQEIVCSAPLFVFQAAEFARDSLDRAMADLRISEPLSQISALFAVHRHKYLLVESVERLLEATQRDAFFSFLARLCYTCCNLTAGYYQIKILKNKKGSQIPGRLFTNDCSSTLIVT